MNTTYEFLSRFSSMTRHFSFENSTMKSWSHIWLMLNRFTLRLSTYRTFAMSNSLGREIIPFPLICDFLPSPKVTLPPFLDSKTLKRDQSPVMCLEQPLSRYHKHVSITLNADFIIKHTSCLDDRSVGMVLSLICLLQAKSLICTLFRQTPLHIFILRQSSFFLVKLRSFPIAIIRDFKYLLDLYFLRHSNK